MQQDEIVVVESWDDVVNVPYEQAFRLANDEPHVIRLRQDPSCLVDATGRSSSLSPYSASYLLPKLEENVGVEGIAGTADPSLVESFLKGKARRLLLEWEPPQRASRLRVLGEWQDTENALQRAHLGCVPQEIAQKLAHGVPDPTRLIATIRTLYLPGDTHPAGIWFDVWALEQ